MHCVAHGMIPQINEKKIKAQHNRAAEVEHTAGYQSFTSSRTTQKLPLPQPRRQYLYRTKRIQDSRCMLRYARRRAWLTSHLKLLVILTQTRTTTLLTNIYTSSSSGCRLTHLELLLQLAVLLVAEGLEGGGVHHARLVAQRHGKGVLRHHRLAGGRVRSHQHAVACWC